MSWNPVLNLIKEIKWEYINKTNGKNNYDFEEWLKVLNNNKYNKIFECLQVNQYKTFILIRYGVADMQESMWLDKDSIYRECRSVVIDLEHEEIVVAPFRKFFNLNEVEENKLDNVLKEIENASSVEFTDKLDGSMQCARFYKGEIFMCGSMSMDANNSWRLKDGCSMLNEFHKKMIIKYPEYTFIFEYISIKDAHVVKYEKSQEGLYLIGIRNINSGYQLSYEEIKRISLYYNVPMAKIEKYSLEDILRLSKILKSDEKEGWVLNIDGHLIKVKCDDYVHLHRLLDKISSVNTIIENIAEDRIDDMLSKIPQAHKNRVSNLTNKIINRRDEMLKEIDDMYNKAPKENRKDFMIWVDKNCNSNIIQYVKGKYLGRDFNILKKQCGYKNIKELGFEMTDLI